MKKAKLFFSTLFVLIAASLYAQNIQVKGTVIDAQTGEGVPFASIVVKGSTQGASSDADGNYSITVASNATLEFSSVGYQTKDINVSGKSTINVTLDPDFESLAETIVVAFGTTTKEAFTGSAAVVKSEDLQRRATANVTNALVGSVPGLQIKGASGAPGAGAGDINVRGIASLSASTSPLIIVDGAPYPASLTNIPQQDIESITVLKDAASAALYGARGAAGVILVTTKRSRSNDAQVNFDMRIGVNSRGIQDYDVITDPAEFYEAYYSLIYNYYTSRGTAPETANSNANRLTLNHLGYNVFTIPDGQLLIGTDGKINPNATLGRSYKFNGETYYMQPDNWTELAYKNAVRQEYNVSINGGNDRASFYASAGYLNEDGIIEYSGYQRFTARVRADYRVKKWLKVGANVGFTQSKQQANPNMDTNWGSTNLMYYTTYIAPIYPVYVRVLDNAGNPVIRTDAYGREQYDYGVSATNYGVGRGFMQTGNPFGSNRYNVAQSNGKQLNGTFTVDIDITPHLHANVSTTVNWGSTLTTKYDNPFYGPKVGVNGELYKSSSTSVRTNNIQTLTYANTFNRHYINVMLGHEYYKTTTNSQGITAQGGFSPEILEVNAFANVLYSGTSSSSSMYNVEGYFLSAQYDFDKRYYFYKFSVLAFNYDENKVCGPVAVDVMLSDEDYLTLLSLQLYERDNFCFNQLLTTNPELAARLNSRVEGEIYGWRFPVHVPFAILFDELRADAEIIDGPIGASEEIIREYSEDEDKTHYVIASAYSRILSITEDTIKGEADFIDHHHIDQINADAVMNALAAKDYRDMMKKLKEKFPTHSAFADIKAWLTASGITFEDTDSES